MAKKVSKKATRKKTFETEIKKAEAKELAEQTAGLAVEVIVNVVGLRIVDDLKAHFEKSSDYSGADIHDWLKTYRKRFI